ncbi:MAG: DUF4390 domain-containing protein [Proteobacteria bacterium]|nr:DUF4390 domain-containing protein [Pseudomonadota bacterium]
MNPLLKIIKVTILFIVYSCLYQHVYAKTINFNFTNAYIDNGVYYVDIDYDIGLTEEAIKALQHGISLEIHTQIQLIQKRKWIWDKKINETILIYRLEHQPLTEDYLVIELKTGKRHSYDRLEAALNYISSISEIPLFKENLLQADANYSARIRTYLDLESLPSPMRPQAYFSPSWDISSKWHVWNIE